MGKAVGIRVLFRWVVLCIWGGSPVQGENPALSPLQVQRYPAVCSFVTGHGKTGACEGAGKASCGQPLREYATIGLKSLTFLSRPAKTPTYPGFVHRARPVERSGEYFGNPVLHRPYIIFIPSFLFSL
jgi:hypothetical protein